MCTTKQLAQALALETLVEQEDREITGGYCGDLLSRVMGSAPADSAWVTVMGNVNAVAVASMADVACMVLAENAPLDAQAAARAKEHGVTVLRSAQPMFELCEAIEQALKAE